MIVALDDRAYLFSKQLIEAGSALRHQFLPSQFVGGRLLRAPGPIRSLGDLGEPPKLFLAAADQRIAVGEEQVVEVAVEQPGISLTETDFHGLGIVASAVIGYSDSSRSQTPGSIAATSTCVTRSP